MKKALILLAFATVLLSSVGAFAEIDLSGLSYAELDSLRAQCQMEMMKRDEWQEVSVPVGVYQVGVEIPAGTWRVVCHYNYDTIITWGEYLEANGKDIDFHKSNRYHYETVYNPKNEYYESGMPTEYTFTVKEGEWIVVDGSAATFTTPTTAALGFK